LPPASPAALRVAPDALEVGVSISPERPSPGLDGGYFTMTVTVRNPRNEAVVVALPPPTDAGPSVSFEYRLEYAGGSSQHNDRALDDAVTRFGPGEIKRQVYDFHVTGTYGFMGRDGLGPGTYRFRAAYGRNWAVSPPTVTLP
jgi:hypothetical protein